MRLGSLVYRHSRWSLVLSLLSIAFLASLFLRLWPMALLRSALPSSGASGCVSCTVDQLALKVAAGVLITMSYCALSVAFLALFVLCGRLLPWRGAALVVAALFAAWAFTRAVHLLDLWRPIPILVADAEVMTAVLAILAAGTVPALVPRVSESLQRWRECRKDEARFLAAAEGSLDGFYILTAVRGAAAEILDFEFTYLNYHGEQLIGLSRQQVLGKRLCVLLPINRTGGFFEDYAQVVRTGEPIVHEFPSQPGDEATRWMRHQVVRLDDGIAITASDITERKQSEQLAHHRAQHDTLTGLPNRSLLNDRLRQAMERADRYHQKVAVFMVDLDGFKQINDTMGHMAGDLVLSTVARGLRESVRATDSVLRIGGDEFLVVMPDVVEEVDILRSAAKMLAALRREGPPGFEGLQLSCSLGIAIYPTLARSAADLVTRADAAMYRAKFRGGNCYEVCGSEVPQTYPAVVLPFPLRKPQGGAPRVRAQFSMLPPSESN